jgi:hypothetical protein
MSSIYDWSTSSASNANADGDINWAEGQAPSTVNNSARVMMQRIKLRKWASGSVPRCHGQHKLGNAER